MSELPYEVLDDADPGCVRIRFWGTLRGQPVHWQARVLTLRHYQQGLVPGAPPVRPFIEVTAVGDGVGTVVVGLPLDGIDPPALIKTVMMLRQWKRLDRGRHEFGPPFDDRGEP